MEFTIEELKVISEWYKGYNYEGYAERSDNILFDKIEKFLIENDNLGHEPNLG